MSSFKNKMAQLKITIAQQESHPNHENLVLKECTRNSSKQELSLQQPIIIEKKTVLKPEQQLKPAKTTQIDLHAQSTAGWQGPRKKVEPWVPVSIPPREKKVDVESMNFGSRESASNKEI